VESADYRLSATVGGQVDLPGLLPELPHSPKAETECKNRNNFFFKKNSNETRTLWGYRRKTIK